MSKFSNEIWYPISGYEGWYEVSNMGRVRSVDRRVYFKNNKQFRDYKGKILKFRYHNGYAMVNLNKNKKMKEYYVHRLVLENFTLRHSDRLWINHINGIKSDNRLENLEWCTPSENNKHAVETGLRHDNIDGLLKHIDSQKKRVAAIKNNKIIKIKDSSRELAEWLLKKNYIDNVDIETAARAIRYRCRSGAEYRGFHFEYIDD